jgi:hypothetical protein
MQPSEQELAEVFSQLSDEALLARCASGDLTPEAQRIAVRQARSRGLHPVETPPTAHENATEPIEAPYLGDFVVVATHLKPFEADLLKTMLESSGIPAEAGDVNMVRMHGLLFNALGGANLRVPQAFVDQARELLGAFKRGELSLKANDPIDDD